MMKKLLFTFFLTVFGLIIMAQDADGDYRSMISEDGNPLEWQVASTWETYDEESGWELATTYPAKDGSDITYTVTIQAGSDVVVFNEPYPFSLNIGNGVDPGEIIIENGAVLAILLPSSDFIIADNGIVTVDGSFNCTCDIINNGEFTINGSYSNVSP